MIDEEFPKQFPTKEKSFLEICKEFLEKLEKDQGENFRKAGVKIAQRIMEDKIVYAVGTGGHTYMPTLDMVHRAGALAPVSATLDISTSPFAGGTRSIRLERVENYFRKLMEYFKIGKGDVVIIFNNIGVNAACIDACLECKERGAYTIGVSSKAWQDHIPKDHPTRHSSNKNMMDIVDLHIDDYNPVGDSVVKMEGLEPPVSPISSITYAYLVRRIEEEAIKYMLDNGFEPPVFWSGNIPGGMEKNAELENKLFYRIKIL